MNYLTQINPLGARALPEKEAAQPSIFPMVESHGGNLREAEVAFGKPKQGWMDLSTAINPNPYPMPPIPPEFYHRLPYDYPTLTVAVQQYYGFSPYAICAGTQQGIQLIPSTLPKQPVLVPEVGYSEHATHWRNQGALVRAYPSHSKVDAVKSIDCALAEDPHQHLVVVNPNNPTGILFSRKKLLSWASQLGQSSMLIVDEAFIDVTPDESLLSDVLPSNVIVLRSFGKFFGLAGIRLGFVFTASTYLTPLANGFGLWPANGPALYLGARALMDYTWHQQTIHNIERAAHFTARLFDSLMLGLGAVQWSSKGLFISYGLSKTSAESLCFQFAHQGILLRLIPVDQEQAVIRIGLICQDKGPEVERICRVIDAIRRRGV